MSICTHLQTPWQASAGYRTSNTPQTWDGSEAPTNPILELSEKNPTLWTLSHECPPSVAFFLCSDVTLLLWPPDGESPSLVHFLSVFWCVPPSAVFRGCLPLAWLPSFRSIALALLRQCPESIPGLTLSCLLLPCRMPWAPTPRISQQWPSQPCQQMT